MKSFRILRSFLLFSLLFALLVLNAGCSDVAKQLKIHSDLSEALNQAQIDKTAEARKWVDRAIKVDPSDPAIFVIDRNSADHSSLSGDESEGPDIASIFAIVGDDHALEYYMQQGAKKFPDNYLILQQLANSQAHLGETAQQLQTAKTLVTILKKKMTSPGIKGYSDLELALAQAYFDSGDIVNGEATYRNYITTYPTDPNGFNGLAYAFADKNIQARLPEALTLANKAITLAKKQGKASEPYSGGSLEQYIGTVQDTVGWIQYRQGSYKSAAESLLEAVTSYPRVPEMYYHQGMVYLALNDRQAARAAFNRAIKINKDYADANREFNKLKNLPAVKTTEDANLGM